MYTNWLDSVKRSLACIRLFYKKSKVNLLTFQKSFNVSLAFGIKGRIVTGVLCPLAIAVCFAAHFSLVKLFAIPFRREPFSTILLLRPAEVVDPAFGG